jgi:hypothetical protein
MMMIRQGQTNIHAFSGIRTHDLSVQAIKTYASDRAVTGTSVVLSKLNDVSEMLTASIIRAIKRLRAKTFFSSHFFACSLLIALMTEAVSNSETSFSFY